MVAAIPFHAAGAAGRRHATSPVATRIALSPALLRVSGPSRHGSFVVALMFTLLCAFAPRAALAQSLDRLEIATASGGHVFNVEVVSDEAGREKGLMYRRYMPQDRGMLFNFNEEAPVAFWMKNTYIPLDMIFISRKGVVTSIVANAEPLSERLIPSGGPVYAVLEVNGGVAQRIGLKAGDKVKDAIFKP
jgi:uncharacterized membrane protein (UPF0127 family)